MSENTTISKTRYEQLLLAERVAIAFRQDRKLQTFSTLEDALFALCRWADSMKQNTEETETGTQTRQAPMKELEQRLVAEGVIPSGQVEFWRLRGDSEEDIEKRLQSIETQRCVWIVHDSEGSVMVPFDNELDALRFALNEGQSYINVTKVPFGKRLRDVGR